MVLTIEGRTILIVDEEGRAPIFLLLLLLADEEIVSFLQSQKKCTAGTYVEF
jgi:hypothetical protein